MSAANGSARPQEASEIVDKGKGKAVDDAPAQDHSMEEDDDEEDEEDSGPEEVCPLWCTCFPLPACTDCHFFCSTVNVSNSMPLPYNTLDGLAHPSKPARQPLCPWTNLSLTGFEC